MAQAPSTDAVLFLGRSVPGIGDQPAEFANDRQLTLQQWNAAMTANGVLIAMNAPAVLGKVEQARLTLMAVSTEQLENFTLSFNTGARSTWAQALEQWLTQVVALRSRIVRTVEEVLGADAAAQAEALFEAAYTSDPYYRLAWELRNLSQHGHQVLDLTTKATNSSANGRPLVEWSLPISKVVDAMDRPNAATALASLWEGTAEVEMAFVIGNTTNTINTVMAQIWAWHEVELRAAAAAVLALSAELEGKPGGRALMNIEFIDGGMAAQVNPLVDVLAESILGTLGESAVIVASMSGEA